MAHDDGACEARDRHRLASAGLSSFLDVEISPSFGPVMSHGWIDERNGHDIRRRDIDSRVIDASALLMLAVFTAWLDRQAFDELFYWFNWSETYRSGEKLRSK
jgi:hypothetical protein